MSESPQAYEPQAVEEKWYDFWVKSGCFTADPASPKPAYSIVIPPPNVTGMLHPGHVLNHTIQDSFSRNYSIAAMADGAGNRVGQASRLSPASFPGVTKR